MTDLSSISAWELQHELHSRGIDTVFPPVARSFGELVKAWDKEEAGLRELLDGCDNRSRCMIRKVLEHRQKLRRDLANLQAELRLQVAECPKMGECPEFDEAAMDSGYTFSGREIDIAWQFFKAGRYTA